MTDEKPKGITKYEWKILKASGLRISRSIVPLRRLVTIENVRSVIVIVNNPRHRHNSGYPFIRAFAITNSNMHARGRIFFDMHDIGWHDHFMLKAKVNVDALGKNIFRIMPYMNATGQTWKARPMFVSTLMLREDGVWE
jgi:hypothetical protein